jgi:hypothetical protein
MLITSFVQIFANLSQPFRGRDSRNKQKEQQPSSNTTATRHPSTGVYDGLSKLPADTESLAFRHEGTTAHEATIPNDQVMGSHKKGAAQKRQAAQASKSALASGDADTVANPLKNKENIAPQIFPEQSSEPSGSLQPRPAGPSGSRQAIDDKVGLDTATTDFNLSKPRSSGLPFVREAATKPATNASNVPLQVSSKVLGSPATRVVPAIPDANALKITKLSTCSDSRGSTANGVTVAPNRATGELKDATEAEVEEPREAFNRLDLRDDVENPLESTKDLSKGLSTHTTLLEPLGTKQSVLPIALKPLAPLVTPPSQVLHGLLEPTTEEGKREREKHLKFMREALAMVGASRASTSMAAKC